MRFGVFGLGDTIYGETFNRGGELMAELLTRHGATQVGEHHRHDNSSSIKPAKAATEWAQSIANVIESVDA